jgi:cobalt-zinc-cadmium efflux system outer membrane protein
MKRVLFYVLVLAAVRLGGLRLFPFDIVWAEPSSSHTKTTESKTGEEPRLAAEEPTGIVTREQAISLAILRNPELKAFSQEMHALEARALQAGLFPNPEVEIEAENFGGEGELDDFDSAEITVQLSQMIQLAGKRKKRRRLATLEQDLAKWDYEAKRADIVNDVTKSFVDFLAAQERLSLGAEAVSLAGEVLNTVSERVKAGKVSPLQETKARVSYSSGLIELKRAKRGLDASRKQLAALWGSTAPLFEKADGDLENIIASPSAKELESLICRNPDISRWTAEMEQRRAVVRLEEAGRIPDVTLSGGYCRLKERDDNAYVMGLSVPLPLFDRNQGGVREARQRLFKAENEQTDAKLNVLKLLAGAYSELSTAYDEAETLRQEVLPGARTAFDASREGYREGKFGYLDVLDSQRTLFDARGQYIEALASYHNWAAEVERLTGTNLDALSKTTWPKQREKK